MMNIEQGRPLGARERLLWLLDQQRPVHFTMAAEITGSYTADQWTGALAAVKQQHPLLAVGIQINLNRAPEFVPQPGRTIPFKIVKTASPNAWIAELEQDAVQRFDSTCAPLLRAALYQCDSRSVIALTAHHAISDGRSLCFILRDLLNAMNGITGQTYSMPPSLDFYTAPCYEAANQIPVSDEIIKGFKQQPPPAWPKPKFEILELSKALSNRIIERSKQEDTSVHGVLCAALVWANKSGLPNPIRIYSPVSVRETVDAGETTCVSIAGRTVNFDTNMNRIFWDTARYAKEALAGANSLAHLSTFNRALLEMLPYVSGFDEIDHFINTVMAHDFLLSNLGALPFDTNYGHLNLKAIWGPFLLPGSESSQCLGVATINGSIRLSLTSLNHTHPMLTLKRLENILHEQFAI